MGAAAWRICSTGCRQGWERGAHSWIPAPLLLPRSRGVREGSILQLWVPLGQAGHGRLLLTAALRFLPLQICGTTRTGVQTRAAAAPRSGRRGRACRLRQTSRCEGNRGLGWHGVRSGAHAQCRPPRCPARLWVGRGCPGACLVMLLSSSPVGRAGSNGSHCPELLCCTPGLGGSPAPLCPFSLLVPLTSCSWRGGGGLPDGAAALPVPLSSLRSPLTPRSPPPQSRAGAGCASPARSCCKHPTLGASPRSWQGCYFTLTFYVFLNISVLREQGLVLPWVPTG